MAEDLWDSDVPLSNAQFRTLLETPLHKRKAALGGRLAKGRDTAKKPKPAPVKEEPEEAELEEHDSPLLPEETTGVTQIDQETTDRPLYRDRARERREGKDAASSGVEGEGMVIPDELTVEDSKFLGGDLEHTHLVKGLDYALLNRERARLQKTEAESAKKQEQKAQQKRSKKGTTFASPMGRAVYSALFKPTKVDAKELFKPGRTAFLYNLEDPQALDCRPTQLRRPKGDSKDGARCVMADADASVIAMLAKIVSYITTDTSEKPQRKALKKEKQQLLEQLIGPQTHHEIKEEAMALTPTPAESEPPEDDIFEDAGTDYKCDTTRKKKKETKRVKTTPEPSKPQVEEVEKADHEMLKMDRRTGKEIDPMSLPDHYAECYPSFHESYSAAVVDSDDEDFSHMDAKNKGVSRYSFETDEEWSQYKQNLEKLPKAAFQYGVKSTDGRKSQSKLAEKNRNKQKLDSQLNKIEKLFKEQGKEHGSAFRKSETAKEDKAATVLPVATPKNRKRIRLDD